MAASKTGLHEYKAKDRKSVFASQITAIEPFAEPGAEPDSLTLRFMKHTGSSKAHLRGGWCAVNKPQIGGYFVVEDDANGKTLCRYVAEMARWKKATSNVIC